MKGSKMRTVNQVKTTNDYNMFKRCKGNRQINKLHVKRLKESMSEEFIPMPIIVNEKNEIIDGQHRFTAAKELGLDIPFIKVNKLGKNQIHRLNTNSKNWNGKDYLYDYCEMGMSDYIVYRDFIEKYGFDWNVTNALLSGKNRMSGKDNVLFIDGLFKVKNLSKAEKRARMLMDFAPFYPCVSVKERGFRRRNFIYAMLDVFDNPDYNHEEFLKKLNRQSAKLYGNSTIEEYLRAVEKIYNSNRPVGQKVRFYL